MLKHHRTIAVTHPAQRNYAAVPEAEQNRLHVSAETRSGGWYMKLEKDRLLLYAVTDRKGILTKQKLYDAVHELLDGGISLLQLREKELPDAEFIEEAFALQALCSAYGCPLIINDRADIAKAVGAAGVHVGQADMSIEEARALLGKDAIIGGSAHNAAEAAAAEAAGADYLGCGAVFGSSTKKNASMMSLDCLAEICQAVRIPVAAIGGINSKNIDQLAGCGISGVAVVSALFDAQDRKAAARELLAQSRRICLP